MAQLLLAVQFGDTLLPCGEVKKMRKRTMRQACTLALALVFLSTHAWAEVTPPVIESFLQNLKAQVQEDLEHKVDIALEIKSCAQDSNCTEVDPIIQKYSEYRIYAGLVQYADLEMRMRQMGRGYIVHQGLRLYFSSRDPKGAEEWALIQEINRYDREQIEQKMGAMDLDPESREYYQIQRQHIQAQHMHYASAVSEFLAYYPFFINSTKIQINRTDLVALAETTGREYERAINNISRLNGDQRFELLGFLESVEKVVENFTERENRTVVNYIDSLNRQTQIWGRIVAILTNWKTLAIGTCHVATFAVAAVPHPVVQLARLAVGTLCASTGVTLSLHYFGQSTSDFIRQLQYLRTGSYSGEVFEQYLRTYVVTTVMTFLYVMPALPAIRGRIQAMPSLIAVTSRAHRMNRLSFNPGKMARFDRMSFASDVRGLGRRYAEYYGEELAISALLTAGGRHAMNLRTIETAIIVALSRAMEREVPIFSYGDLLTAV
jgi:hypothetical protein